MCHSKSKYVNVETCFYRIIIYHAKHTLTYLPAFPENKIFVMYRRVSDEEKQTSVNYIRLFIELSLFDKWVWHSIQSLLYNVTKNTSAVDHNKGSSYS